MAAAVSSINLGVLVTYSGDNYDAIRNSFFSVHFLLTTVVGLQNDRRLTDCIMRAAWAAK